MDEDTPLLGPQQWHTLFSPLFYPLCACGLLSAEGHLASQLNQSYYPNMIKKIALFSPIGEFHVGEFHVNMWVL